jgi:hypothetical protein
MTLPRHDLGGDVLDWIAAERSRQDAKWGVQNHDPGKWMLILLEEIGEFSKTALERAPSRCELVQVAAVAAAMIECGERNGWWKA